MRILVIAAHPDDEVYGCGGTIARYARNGEEVHVRIMTSGYAPDWSAEHLKRKEVEIEAVSRILGLESVVHLGFPTVKLDTVPQKELNDSISEIVDAVAPEVLYIPHRGDLNKDHRLLFEASLVAVRPVGSPVKRILSYETLSVTEWGRVMEPFVPNVYVDISTTIETKIEAARAYADELRPYPHPRSVEVVEALARVRGSEAGMECAEAFVLIRELA